MVRSKNTIATPPGATIKEQLEDRGMSQKDFSVRMGLSEKHISQLINGEVRLTHETAERLEMVLGVPARFWNNLEAIYQEALLKAKAENEMESEKELAQKIPYKELEKEGWVPHASKTDEKIINLRKFFEVARLDYLRKTDLQKIACRKLGASEKSDFALLAWTQAARLAARKIETMPVNIKRLRESIPKIRQMTTASPSSFCSDLEKIMSDCGIAIVFLPHIPGSYLQGATFYDGDKIVMGLTVRGKSADKFWFSLFHEIGHVLDRHIDKSSGPSEDDERRADQLAADMLIEPTAYHNFVASKQFDEHSIEEFAKDNCIDIGIVIGRLQKEERIPYSKYNYLKKSYTLSA